MRFHLIGLMLLASIAVPAAAQRPESLDKRLDRIEQELKAVQRRVFPGANGPVLAPEMEAPAPAASPAGVPATSAVADINARLDSIEAQLRALTGQSEQNANRLRTTEEGLAQLRQAAGSRLDALEKAAQAANRAAAAPEAEVQPPPAPAPVRQARRAPEPAPAAADASPAAADDAEGAYNDGFHLWEQKKFAAAQQALEQVARDHPGSKWASWARNLEGRAYLDAGRPATAAKTFLANYQNDPKGERAADSLYFLGQALVALNKPADACKAYDELQDVYGANMRTWLKQQLPTARSEAKCRKASAD
jgi:TolA-binding protein